MRGDRLGYLTGLFAFLSIAVTFWLAYELELLSFRKVAALERGAEKSAVIAEEKRLKEIEHRELDLTRKEQLVRDRESFLNEQIARYEKMMKELQSRIAELQSNQSLQKEAFRQVYEKMDPKRASRILDEMEIGMAAEILGSIRQPIAAEILGRMNAQRARLITERNLRISSSKTKVSEAEDQGKGVK